MLGCWQEQGTRIGFLPDGRHDARSVANGYFLHPQKGAGRGVPKRNTLLLSVCLDSGHTFSGFLGQRTRAAEVLTYADVWGDGWRRQEQARGHNAILRSQGREQPRMDSTGGHGSRSGRQGTEDSRSSRPDERAGQQGSTAGEQAKRGRAAMPGRASGCPENGQARPWRS